jgi:hypothetical protein
MMEELHTDSIDGGHEASYGTRSRARERAKKAQKAREKELRKIEIKKRHIKRMQAKKSSS